jgi:multiple sugar transport system substrate-binding protein
MSHRWRFAGGLAAFVLAMSGLADGARAQTEVRVVVAYYSDQSGPIFEGMAEEFEAAHPDIDIQIEVVNWDNLEQKLITDIAGGTAPDISIIGTRWLAGYVKEGIAEPLDDYMSEEFKAKFIDTFITPSVFDGETYGLPVAASARAMYYNEAMFEQAGITTPPATWQELKEAAAKIDALGDDVYGFGIQGKEIETDAYWYYALWSFGGELLENGKSGIASEAGIEAAAFYKSLIDQGLTQPGVTNYSREGLQDLFKQGRLGMIITGPFLLPQMEEEAPDIAYGVAPIPKGETSATYGVTDSIMLFADSDVKEEAWQFLEETAFSDKWRREFTLKESFLPVLKSVAEDPHFANDPGLAAFTSMLPDAKFAPTIPNWEEMADITSSALQRIYLGEAQPEEALPAAAEEINGLLGN